jgi:hypothetical protein
MENTHSEGRLSLDIQKFECSSLANGLEKGHRGTEGTYHK